MDKAVEEFLSKISKEKFWKYLEVKACLLKHSEDRIWKVAFINIQLVNESKVTDRGLPSLDNLMLIHKILRIDALHELIEQIAEGHQIRIGAINASLEWIRDKPRYDSKMRAYVKQEYHIDEACHVLFKGGDYHGNLDSVIQYWKPVIWQNHVYRDLKDALKSLLDIEFGTPAFSPFGIIIAPIYVKIEESNTEIGKIEVVVSSVPEANPSKIKLLIFGEDENARPTELRKQVTTFTRKEGSDLMNLIAFVVDEQTRYVKLSLYYDKDLIEDYYVRVPKRVVRQIIESVEVTERPPRKKYEIRKDKQKIKTNYTMSKDEDNNPNVKGKLLEEVIIGIIELVPGLKVEESRVTNEIQEIDIIVRNFNKTKVWADFESVFFVECKNWFKKKKPGADRIRDFKGKLENKNLKTGIFVAPNGIAEGKGNNKVSGTNGQIDKYFHSGTKIIVLDDEDIRKILDCKDVTETVNHKFMELYKS